MPVEILVSLPVDPTVISNANNVPILSGQLIQADLNLNTSINLCSGQIINLSGNLNISGKQLSNSITGLSGCFNQTGTNLWNNINNLSGGMNSMSGSFNQTGNALLSGINNCLPLSGGTITGNIHISGITNSGSPVCRFYNNSGVTFSIGVGASLSNVTGIRDKFFIYDLVTNTPRLCIDSSGNISGTQGLIPCATTLTSAASTPVTGLISGLCHAKIELTNGSLLANQTVALDDSFAIKGSTVTITSTAIVTTFALNSLSSKSFRGSILLGLGANSYFHYTLTNIGWCRVV